MRVEKYKVTGKAKLSVSYVPNDLRFLDQGKNYGVAQPAPIHADPADGYVQPGGLYALEHEAPLVVPADAFKVLGDPAQTLGYLVVFR